MDQLFLHGDILDAGYNLTQLSVYRQRFVDDRHSRGRLANRLYDSAIATRLHRIRHEYCIHRGSLHENYRVFFKGTITLS